MSSIRHLVSSIRHLGRVLRGEFVRSSLANGLHSSDWQKPLTSLIRLIAPFVIGFALFSGENAVRVSAQEPPLSSAWRWASFGQEAGLGTGHFTAFATAGNGTLWATTGSHAYWFDNWLWHAAKLPEGSVRQLKPRAATGAYVLVDSQLLEGDESGFRAMPWQAEDPRLRLLSIASAGDGLLALGFRGNAPVFLLISPDGTRREIPSPADLQQPGADPRLWSGGGDSAILTTSRGLYRWSHKGWTTMHRWSDPPARVRELIEDTDGNGMLVVETDSNNGGYWEWRAPGALRHRPNRGDSTIAALAASPGVALRAYFSGKVEFRNAAGEWSDTTYLPATLQAVRAAYVGPAGDIWFGAIDNIGEYRASSARWTTLKQPVPSPLDRVNAVLARARGEMWLGTADGVLIVDTREDLRPVRHIPKVLDQKLGAVTGLAEDGAGRVWVTSGSAFSGAFSWDGRVWRRHGPQDGLANAPIHDVAIDRSGRPWLLSLSERGTDSGAGAYMLNGDRFERWSTRDGLPSDRIYAFAEGHDGTRWFGTSAGLSRWRAGQWTHWPARTAVVNGVVHAQPIRVFTLALDAMDRPWFGETRTASAFGLATIGADDRLHVIGAPAGAASQEIWRVTFDADQTLWATTSEGLAARTNDTWHFLSPQHGLGVSPWPVVANRDGIFVGTHDGLYRLNRQILGGTPPRVMLDTIAVDAGQVFLQWRTLAYRGFTPPSTIETRYQLDDGPWSAWGTQRAAHILNLAPGAHAVRFEAKTPFVNSAKNAAVATIQVPWPLYQRVEVLALTGLLVIGLVAIGLASWRNRRRSQRERAVAEARLRASEEKFSTLFWASPLPLLIASEADGRIIQVNQAAEVLAGLGAAALAGHPAFAVAAAFGGTEPAREPVMSREVEFVTPDGRELALLLHTSRLRLDHAPCLITAITDITGLRRLEESLLSAQRLEAIGQISGGVAHEFNNLLTVMQGHTDALASTLAPMTEAVRRHVDALGRSVARAAQITNGLLTFAKRQPTAGQVTDLNVALIELQPMIEGLIGRAISVKQDLDPAVPLIALGPPQIAQLLVNLSLNARDAMPDGGNLTVATRLVDGSGPDDGTLLSSNTGPWVSLVIRDNGCGMTEEVRRHVFEPFFSTKPSRQAMGLGLSICYGVVERAGGRIDVESSPGRGTVVRILLPSAIPSERVALMPQPPLQLGTQGQVVLLVEDEVDVREIVAEVLEQAGYTVQACPSLQAVEALLAQGHKTPDLLLTDLVLPEGSGLAVAALVTQRYPGLPVLFMSGYSESVYSGVDSVTHLLPKPFTSPTLLRRVRELLETEPV